MPNLNKLRGGKIGPGARPGAGQYGMGGAKYHNSESRLQQPQSRMMQGEIMSVILSLMILGQEKEFEQFAAMSIVNLAFVLFQHLSEA